MALSAGLLVVCRMQIRSQAVRGLKPLLGCSRTVAPASRVAQLTPLGPNILLQLQASHPTPAPAQLALLRSWLAWLRAVAAYIAGVVERAPFTGRPQLIFDIYKSAPGQRAAMPAVHRLPFAIPLADPSIVCKQRGDQVLDAAYARVAEAVAGLAANNPALQSRLASFPDEINLILLNNFSGCGMQSYACGKDVKAASIHLLVDAGSLLQQSTADEVVTSVAKEMAHVIASHSAEQESCKSLFTSFIGAAGVAAMMCRVSIWRCLPAMMLAHYIGSRWGARTWLHRQQVFEADAIAPAISTAAGFDPSSVVTSMQRAYCADASTPTKANLQQVRKSRTQWHLAKLQSLLLQSQIPQDMIRDSAAMQLVTAAAASEIRDASAQVKAEYDKSISVLEDCLGEELCCVRNPFTPWTDINPHWLDRIAHVQNVLKHDSSLGVQGKGLNNSGQDVHNRARYAHWHAPAKFWLETLLLISEIRGSGRSSCELPAADKDGHQVAT